MKTKKVKFLRPGAGFGFAYFDNDTAELLESDADKLIKLKVCSEILNDGTDLPKDFPSRDLLADSGIKTLEGLEGFTKEMLIELEGIGKAYAEKILEAYNELVKA